MKHKMAAVREVFLTGCRRLRAVIPIKEALLRGSAMNTSIHKQCLCRSNRAFHSEAVEGGPAAYVYGYRSKVDS